MDAGTAAVLGATVGAIGPILLAYMQHRLPNRRAEKLADKRRARLRQLLSDPKFEWRNLATLMAAIGTDREATIELLLEIDAYATAPEGDKWRLASRTPMPN